MTDTYPMELGLEHGPPLLYLPGLDGTGRLLFCQEALGETYRVLCQSYPQDRKTTYQELADAAAERLENEADGRPAVVIGESFGGAVSLTLALSRPELVERLVLVNTFARYPRRYLARLGAILGVLSPSRPSPAYTRRFRGWAFFALEVPEERRTGWWERTADVPVRAFWRRTCMIAGLDLTPRLPEIHVPALVLVAPNDRIVHPRAGRLLAEKLPHAELIEVPAGHAALVHPSVDLAELLASRSVDAESEKE